MKELLTKAVLLLSFALALPAAAIDTAPEFQDPVLKARYEKLIHELRCLQCQNNSIADSPVGLASDLRRSVREQLEQGKSDEEILKYMTERYGDFVLYRPPFVPRTWLLWLGPVLLLGGGALIAYRIVSRRTQLVGTDDSDLDGDEEGGRR
jgi:cytochrome c-type biogenesis protein CcmH